MDYRLSVDRDHLLQGLRMFKKAPRKAQQRDRAILGFDGRYLTVEAHEKVFLAHAVGAWPGNASVSACAPVLWACRWRRDVSGAGLS